MKKREFEGGKSLSLQFKRTAVSLEELPICPANLQSPINDKSPDCLKKKDVSFINVEPYYANIYGLDPKYYTPKNATSPAKVPTDMPACADLFYKEVFHYMSYLQITMLCILLFEVFEIIVVIVMICLKKKEKNKKKKASQTTPTNGSTDQATEPLSRN